MNPINTFPSYLFNIRFYIILQSTLVLLNGLFPSGFPAKTLYVTCHMRTTCTAHLILHVHWCKPRNECRLGPKYGMEETKYLLSIKAVLNNFGGAWTIKTWRLVRVTTPLDYDDSFFCCNFLKWLKMKRISCDFREANVSVPITVATRSRAWTVFAHSNTGIMGSNPTRGIEVCLPLLCVCVVLCVDSGLTTGWSPVQGVLPIVYRLRNWKSGQGLKGL
jgi:hypothetical protein